MILLARGTHRRQIDSILAIARTTVRRLVREAHGPRVDGAIALGLVL